MSALSIGVKGEPYGLDRYVRRLTPTVDTRSG